MADRAMVERADVKAKRLWGPDAFARVLGEMADPGFDTNGEFIVGEMNGVKGGSLYSFEAAFEEALSGRRKLPESGVFPV